jgi:hypothetical protein
MRIVSYLISLFFFTQVVSVLLIGAPPVTLEELVKKTPELVIGTSLFTSLPARSRFGIDRLTV